MLADQLRVDALPFSTVLGFAVKVTDGGNADTVTVADCVAEPPSPVHVTSYSVVLTSAAVDNVPLNATGPLQLAVQAVASLEFHVKTAEFPDATVVGAAARVTVGAGVITITSADWLELPPVPVHVKV